MFSGGIEVEHWLKMGYCTVSNFTNTLALLYPFIISLYLSECLS